MTIVYGCLEQHLTEYNYCHHHGERMLGYLEKGIIGCQHPIRQPMLRDDDSIICNKIIVEWDHT